MIWTQVYARRLALSPLASRLVERDAAPRSLVLAPRRHADEAHRAQLTDVAVKLGRHAHHVEPADLRDDRARHGGEGEALGAACGYRRHHDDVRVRAEAQQRHKYAAKTAAACLDA